MRSEIFQRFKDTYLAWIATRDGAYKDRENAWDDYRRARDEFFNSGKSAKAWAPIAEA